MTRLLCTCCSLVLALSSGCGRNEVEIAPVTGTVMMGGKALPDALLRFCPEGGGRSSQGITDKDGNYKLAYTNRADGARVGKCKVLITTGPLEDTSRRKETVPKKYNDESELLVEVTSRANVINFDLDAKK